MSQRLSRIYKTSQRLSAYSSPKVPRDRHGGFGIACYTCPCGREDFVLNLTSNRIPLFTTCPGCGLLWYSRSEKEGWASPDVNPTPQKGELVFVAHTHETALDVAKLHHHSIYGKYAEHHLQKLHLLAESIYNTGRGVRLVKWGAE